MNQERIFYVKKIDRDQPLLSGVIVQEYDHNGLKRILNADQAFLDNGKWVFIKGVMYEVGSRGEVERVVRFEKEEMYTQQSMEDVLKSQKNPQEMSYKELQEYIAQEHGPEKNTDFSLCFGKKPLFLLQPSFLS